MEPRGRRAQGDAEGPRRGGGDVRVGAAERPRHGGQKRRVYPVERLVANIVGGADIHLTIVVATSVNTVEDSHTHK